MLLKAPQKKKEQTPPGMLLLVAFCLGLFFALGMMMHEAVPEVQLLANLRSSLRSFFPGTSRVQQTRLTRLQLHIKHKHFKKLVAKRTKALSSGVLLTSKRDYIPARLRYKGKRYKVKLRLKGDWTDHLHGPKWSFRVQMKGGRTLFGMKKFSLQHPRTRNYLYEWLYHKALRREDVMALRYDFVQLRVNDKELGIFALEEHFGKRLIEHQNRREGIILRLNEDLFWRHVHRNIRQRMTSKFFSDIDHQHTSAVDAFQQGKILKTPRLREQFILAKGQLETFRLGKIPSSKLFQLEKVATYFAISDLLGAQHGAAAWHNLRFYHNPLTARFELIGFDGMSGTPITQAIGAFRPRNKLPYDFHDLLFQDRALQRAYTRALEKVTRKDYLRALLADTKAARTFYKTQLRKEFPRMQFNRRVLEQNRAILARLVNPVQGMEAYFQKTTKALLLLQLRGLHSLPIEVLGISCRDKRFFAPQRAIILSHKSAKQPILARSYPFLLASQPAPTPDTIRNCRAHYRVIGGRRTYREGIKPWPHTKPNFVQQILRTQTPNLQEFPFLKLDKKTRRISFAQGSWRIQKMLVLPKGYTVIIPPDTQLDLCNKATILSYSPLYVQGTRDAPVRLYSSDGTGRGLTVVQTPQPSRLSYVSFSGLRNPVHRGQNLTGAVTFYEAPLRCNYCVFAHNKSEDALNVVRSRFTLRNTAFYHTLRDAFDADFSKGSLSEVHFQHVGNDAVDVSGSQIRLHRVRIQHTQDKGLSIGENSRAQATFVLLQNTKIAVAVKDSSVLTLKHVSIDKSQLGFTLFRKKPEFSGGTAYVTKLQMRGVLRPYLIERGSKLHVEGRLIPANDARTKSQLYPPTSQAAPQASPAKSATSRPAFLPASSPTTRTSTSRPTPP